MKHLCTSCYLKGKKDYMLEACQFAVTKATDFYEMYASQGRWTRCVHCMEEARFRVGFCEAMSLAQLGELGGGETLSAGEWELRCGPIFGCSVLVVRPPQLVATM